MDSNPAIAAVPLQTIRPTTKSAKKREKVSNKCMYRPFVSQPMSPNHCDDESPTPKKPKNQTQSGPNVKKRDLVHDYDKEVCIDFSKVPPPICSCSGFDRRCFKAGPGAWQSACCTLSEYPLPFKALKPGKRVTGRKMCAGPYRKLLYALAKEGVDLGQPVDLKDHWAKVGTNKFARFK